MGVTKSKCSLTTSDARKNLPNLVQEMRAKDEPSEDLLAGAVEIGPHRQGGAMLLPEVDVTAHVQRLDALKDRVAELEDELEDLSLLMVVQERLAAASGERLSTEEFLRGIGMGELVAGTAEE